MSLGFLSTQPGSVPGPSEASLQKPASEAFEVKTGSLDGPEMRVMRSDQEWKIVKVIMFLKAVCLSTHVPSLDCKVWVSPFGPKQAEALPLGCVSL